MKSFATHSPPAARLDDRQRRRGRLFAYASAWFGCYAEVMIESSAIVILYLTLLQSSATLTMLSTAFSALAAIMLTIPSAGIASRIGLRHSYTTACYIACAGLLLMAAAPVLGAPLDKYTVLLGCLIYCLSRPLYVVTWYPMLDNVLLPAERIRFFGTLRFSYLVLTASSFFLVSLAMGKNPPIWALQLVIAVVGVLVLGRKYCLDRLPVEDREKIRYDLRQSLTIVIRNRPLVGWSVYTCCLTLASSSLLPLAMIYLKFEIMANAKVVQWMSVAYMAGLILCHLFSAKLVRLFGVRRIMPAGHLCYAASAFGLFFFGAATPGFLWLIGAILFLVGFSTAITLNCYSLELMALARPDNRTMASAFLSTYKAIGDASSRFLTSLILGACMLMPHWSRGGLTFCSYQTLFLLFAVLQTFFLLLLFLVPSIVPKNSDYYVPY